MKGLPESVQTLALQAPAGMLGEFSSVGDRRYEKDMIRVGRYVHPVKGWELDVDRKMLQTWADNFNRFREAGIKVPVTVDHSKKAEDLKGELVGMRVEGDVLLGVHEFDDEDGEKLTKKKSAGVSIEIDDDFIASTGGKKMGSAIVASSIVQRPIVSGQNDFVKIAASRDGGDPQETDSPVLELGTREDKPMKDLIKKLNTRFELSIDSGADEDAVLKAIDGLRTKSDNGKELSRLQGEVDRLTRELDEAGKEDALNPTVKGLSSAMLDQQLEKLVEAGNILPDVRDDLKPELSTTKMLSVDADGDDPNPRFMRILKALSKNDPVAIGEKSAEQSGALPPKSKEDAEAQKKEDAETVSDMVELSGAGKRSNKEA